MANVDKIAELRGISLAEAIDFWKQVSAAAGIDISTYEVLLELLAQGEYAASISADQLAESRKALEEKRRRSQEELQTAEAARRRALSEDRAAEEEEFRQLVVEMPAHKFNRSSQVSAYIVSNRLGNKYKHISGILKMEMDGNFWDFKGGFPPKIYARLCKELGLGNQGSHAVPQEFTPYKDIIEH